MGQKQAAAASIKLHTEVPGPKSRAILERRSAALARGAIVLAPIVVDRAHGSLVTDVDGNTFIDLAGGIGVLTVGHTPDNVKTAIREQVEKLIHMCAIVAPYESLVAVAERLNALAPGDFAKKTLLMNTGAEAVENAVSVSRSYTKRQGIVVFEGAFHGRTNLAMAMTSKFARFKTGFGPFAPEIYRFPFPNIYHRPPGLSVDDFVSWHVDNLDHLFHAFVEPAHVAAIVVEPVQGEGGFIPAPAPWLQRLRQIADDNGIVLVADEIQCGLGRTGKMWAIDHSGVVPDLVLTAKGLAAGMQLSAVVGRAEIIDAPEPGSVGGTYSGNPLACAASLAALDTICAPGFLPRVNEVAARLRGHLEKIANDHPRIVGGVRGLGSMLAIEIVDPATRQPWSEGTTRILAEALEHGVICIRAGLYLNCIRFLPPLTISDAEIDEAFAVLSDAAALVDGQQR